MGLFLFSAYRKLRDLFCFPGVFCVGESNSEWVWGSLMFNHVKSERTLRDHGGPRQIAATLNLLEHARQCQILPQKAGFLLAQALYCLQKASMWTKWQSMRADSECRYYTIIWARELILLHHTF